MRFFRFFLGGCLLALVGGVGVAADLADRLGGLGSFVEDPLALIRDELSPPVEISAVIEPGGEGRPDILAVTARLDEGWHLYSITQQPGGPRPTKITLAPGSRQVAGPFEPDAAPQRHAVEDVPAWKGLVLEEHSDAVTWRAPLAAAVAGAATEARGSVSLQLCRDNACVPPETFEFSAVAPAEVPSLPAVQGIVTGSYAPQRGHAALQVVFDPRAGRLELELVPEPGWHLYAPSSTAQSGVGQGKPTIVAGGPPIGEVTATRAQASASAELAETGAVDGPVAFTIALQPDLGDGPLDLLIGLQTCSDTTCDPPTAVRILGSLPGPSGAAELTFTEARYAEAARDPLAISLAAAKPGPIRAAADGAQALAAVSTLTGSGSLDGITLPLALLMGLAGGLILNLMPCVLPVLGLKLMAFAQQSGRARREVFEMNLWYCAGLFAVFFVLATASVAANVGLGASNLAWGEQFTSVRFNVAMTAVVFAFALSFLGVWELPIPGFIGEQAGHAQSREGPLGAFLKGVLSTVLATPCSGPFLGPVFGFTLTQSTPVTYAVFGAIATGMALPYILVGLFPALVRFMPRPGPWMATFKELLGFVMLGTVVYLFTFLRSEWFVPTLALLVGIWAACWWVGRAQERLGAGVPFGRWVQAAAIMATVGSFAFLFLGPGRSLIDWEQPFSKARLAQLRADGATVMVDFSADWCPTCKLNLATAIETRRVKAMVERNRVVPMLADWTDGSPEIKQMLESLGSKSIPLLAIFPAGEPGRPRPEPIILRDLLTESQVLEALERAGPSCCPPPEIRAASTAPIAPGR
jgi:suppressor for copper-sensitivity B